MRTMSRAVCAATLFLVSAAGQAAESPSPGIVKTIVSGLPHSALFGLSFDGTNGVAVGGGGAIMESQDSGQTWKSVVQDQTTMAMLAVDRRGSHTIAVGIEGTVLVREDQGAWTKVQVSPPSRLLSVSVNQSGLAIATGEFGTVLKSTDAGHTWTSIAPDWSSMVDKDNPATGEPSVYAAVIDTAGVMTIAGEFGLLMRSSDGGANWSTLLPVRTGAATLFGLYIAPVGKGNSFAVGQAGELLSSSDGGMTWFRCSGYTKLNLLGVAASPSGEVVVTGMRVMMRSQNGGMSWSLVREGDISTDWYQAVRTVPQSGRILAVGHAGKIIEIANQ